MSSLNSLKGIPCGLTNTGTTRVVYGQDGSVAIFCDAPPPPAPPMYSGLSVSGQFATVTFDRKVCRTATPTLEDWEVVVGSDSTTYHAIGTSVPDCNATFDNGVTSALIILSAPVPDGSQVSMTLTTIGGAIYRDQAGLTVAAPQTRTAVAATPTPTPLSLTTASGDVGSTIITLGFSTNVYCAGFSFNATDIVITDNNPATSDPIVTGMGPNSCGFTPVSADPSFSITVNMPLSPSTTYTVILTPEPDEIQDTLFNDLPNPSEVSFTTAAADTTPPTLIDTQLVSNRGTTDFGEVGDEFTVTFSEAMNSNPFGGINVQDGDGSVMFMQCGPLVQCNWSGTVLTVTVTAQLAPLPGVTPGLQLPLLITTMNGFSDLQGNAPNILGSPDRTIDNELVSGPFAPPTLTDSRVVNNLGSSDFVDVGDAFTVTFSGGMNLNPIGNMLVVDQDGTFALINCGLNAICTWNSLVTELTVIVSSFLTPSIGSTPGLQIPMNVAMMSGIASGTNGKVPDLAGSADRLIDFE